MTDLLSRPLPRVDGGEQQPRRPVQLLSVAAAAWATILGLVACVLVAVIGWLAGSTGTAADALRVGADGWLLAHGTALQVSGATVAVLPLGLTVAAGALLYRSGAWAGAASDVSDLWAAARATGILTGCYAGFAAVVAVLAGTSAVRPEPIRAFVGAGLLAAVCGGSGLLRGADLGGLLAAVVPAPVRAAAYGVAAGVAAMLAAGAVLVALGLLADLSSAQVAAGSLHAGAVGGAVLALVGVVLMPNAAVWAAAFAVGPGFTVGTGTLVAPTDVRLGPVPAFPLLAALPAEGSQPWWVIGLVVVPVVAGALAAVVALRRHPLGPAGTSAALAGCTAAVAGLVFGLLAALAGASGPGRLAHAGPNAGACALAATAAMALGGLLGWAGWELLGRRRAKTGGGTRPAAG